MYSSVFSCFHDVVMRELGDKYMLPLTAVSMQHLSAKVKVVRGESQPNE